MTNKNLSNMCRLCGGALKNIFSQKVMGKYDVLYYKCSDCDSLQTETPYWLDEAYKTNNLSNTDTGAVQRNLHNFAACYIISKILRATNVIDVGGGDGLLCRLLRDYKINCYVKDKYANPTYGQGFTEQNFDTPDLIVGFEVLEHYPNPTSELDNLFSYNPRALFLSTAIFTNEQQDWWYLAPESGQHVFFYSKKSIAMIATKYKYDLVMSGGFILFVKKASMLTKVASYILLNGRVVKLLKLIILLLPPLSVWQDHLLQVKKSKKAQQWLYSRTQVNVALCSRRIAVSMSLLDNHHCRRQQRNAHFFLTCLGRSHQSPHSADDSFCCSP